MKRITLCTLLCTLFLSALHAQPKSIGTTFSYAGVGVVYEHHTDDRSFAEIQLRMETSSVFADRKFEPGISGSFTWNMEFAETETRDGSRIIFFAGPGAAVGLTEDLFSRRGLMLGLKGRVGAECRFSRNITVSMGISPVIGVHIAFHEGMLNMLLYKTGLLYTIMPEIGIKYAF